MRVAFGAKAEAMAQKYNTTIDEIIYIYVDKMDTQIDNYRQRHDLIEIIITNPAAEDLYWNIVETTLLATKDTLTGLDNRRSMQSQLDKLANNFNRKQTSFSFIYIDLDNFKKINDKFNHSVGDAVLKAVTRSIKSHVRAIDLACRIGEEEMAVIMDGDKSAAIILAERIRASVENIDVEALGIDRNQHSNITAKIGVAEYKHVPGFNNAEAIKLLLIQLSRLTTNSIVKGIRVSVV